MGLPCLIYVYEIIKIYKLHNPSPNSRSPSLIYYNCRGLTRRYVLPKESIAEMNFLCGLSSWELSSKVAESGQKVPEYSRMLYNFKVKDCFRTFQKGRERATMLQNVIEFLRTHEYVRNYYSLF